MVRNNRIANNGLRGIYISASNDCLVEFNQLLNNGILIHGMPRSSRGVVRTLKNNLVRNNIIQNNRGHVVTIAPEGQDPNIANNRLENNLYVAGDNPMYWFYGHNNATTDFNKWVQQTADTSHVGTNTDRQAPNLLPVKPWSSDPQKRTAAKH